MKAFVRAIGALAIAALLIDALSPCSLIEVAGNSTYTADSEPATIMIAACPCGCPGASQATVGLSLPAILPCSIAEVDTLPGERPSTPYVALTSSVPEKRLHKVPRFLS